MCTKDFDHIHPLYISLSLSLFLPSPIYIDHIYIHGLWVFGHLLECGQLSRNHTLKEI